MEGGHKLELRDRKVLRLDGVTEVLGFEPASVMLQTELGILMVQGKNLQLKELTKDSGLVEVDGEISALVYEEPRVSGWRGLFR